MTDRSRVDTQTETPSAAGSDTAAGPVSAPTAPDFGDDSLNAAVSTGLQRAEERLFQAISSGESFLTDKTTHLALAGGKRFRVMFAILAAQYGPKADSDEVIDASVVIELTHLATLYHDDVMDEADRRRGADSANKRWDNSVAILAGDYLFALASAIMANLGADTVRHFAATFQELVTGQMRETVGSTDGLSPVDHYMTVIQEKTGVLIASAGYLGSLHAGATPEIRDGLARFGRHMGQLFQIIDDVIDIWADPEVSGKEPGTDLREGVATLPVLFAMEQDDATGARLRELLTKPLTDDAEVEEALELIKSSQGRERTLAAAEEYRLKAEQELEALPAGAVTNALRALLGFAFERLN